IHLLVTDVVMPGMSGGTLAQRIRETQPESRVLFMSGYTEDAIVRYGVVRSESALLAKPFTQATFVARVREVLDRAEPPRDADPRRAA
ncbi:MAG TPA: response regulator, partial [Methylomirabilota bacterium]|nr:response regulator [Methylomirabilota bacterium]